MYSAVDAAMIRTSAFPLAASLPSWPGISGDATADTAGCRLWIAEVWADNTRADAVEFAAPALADGVRRVLDGSASGPRPVRTAVSLMRYLLRMQYRATPFGLFAGAAPVRLGVAAHVRFGTRHRAFARADATWLHHVVAGLECDPDVLRRLPVIADPTCTVRGARIAVVHQPGTDGPTETDLRRTRAAEKVLALAHSPIAVGDIVARLHADYPDTSTKTIEAMVRDLVAHRVLLTSLHAPMTCDDALGHLLEQLDAAGAAPLVPTARTLRHVHQLLNRHNQADPGEQSRLRTEATGLMARLTGPADRSLAVNLGPDCDITLPESVAREAGHALEVISRITPFPNGTPAWADYRARFLERYSMGTVVPLRDLTDLDTGLGFPAGYRSTVLKRPVLATTPRDEHLLELAQDAALTDRREIVLSEKDIEALSVGEPTQVPAHIELCFTVLAHTQRALDRGRFALSVAGLSLSAGTTTGRFLQTLHPAERARMTAAYAALPTLTAGAIRAQVSGPPLKVPTYNVSRAPATVPDLCSVGEHNPAATLHLDDLGVVADAGRLYLVALTTGQVIEPSVMNAVEPSNATHPLVRFVCELHRSHSAVLIPFAWGAASRLPFLPEVRVGRTILSPACWRLRARDLAVGDSDWLKRFFNWRIRYGVPRTVYVGADDQRLRLDLDVPAHQHLLRWELKRQGTAVLHEAPPESAFGWIGHSHEVTMAFAANQSPAAPTCRTTAIKARDTGRLPGASPWLYLKLYGNPARMPEVLTSHMPRLLSERDATPAWWFTRYADPDHHLRLRLRLPGLDELGDVVQRAAAWAAELRGEGLIQRMQWDTDEPETGRYGTGTALEAAERVFAADSAASLAQLSLPLPAVSHPAVTAASFVDIATALLGSPRAARAWLTTHLLRTDGDPVPRNLLAQAIHLSEPGRPGQTALLDLVGGDRVLAAWRRRSDALSDYHRTLRTAGSDPVSVLPSLLHMHHNRAAGIDPDAEATCRRLARAAALSWTTRTEGSKR